MTRPEVVVAWSLTVDGKTAPCSHRGELADSAEALLFGRCALVLDDPEPTDALAVVVSGRGLVLPESRIFSAERRPIVAVSQLAPPMKRERLAEVAEVVVLGDAMVDLAALLDYLGEEHGVRRVLSQGGAQLNRSLLEARLFDGVHVALAPTVDEELELRLVGQHGADGELRLQYRIDGE